MTVTINDYQTILSAINFVGDAGKGDLSTVSGELNQRADIGIDDVGSDFFLSDATGPFSLGLGIFDIAALQEIYGADTTTRTGDKTYNAEQGFGATVNDAFVYTIWDAANDNISMQERKAA